MMSARTKVLPSLDFERGLWARGYRCIAGLDEAGRGAWAGPVVAAAVVLPAAGAGLLQHLRGVRDSKQLTPARRTALMQVILEQAVTWGIGSVAPDWIDEYGIVAATRRAMELALHDLSPPADSLLIDHLSLPAVPLPQHSLPRGDARVLSIAAASILAKVTRDRIMEELDPLYAGYGLARHKGYGTEQHRAALEALGPSAVHRMSFAPLRQMHQGREPVPGLSRVMASQQSPCAMSSASRQAFSLQGPVS